MKRFAFFFNLHPRRLENIPWFVENFKYIPFRPYVDDLNDYEAVWIYTCSGANSKKVNEHFTWREVPEYLRKHGVTVPILYQEDYYYVKHEAKQPYDTYFHADYALKYVDGIIYCGGRNWAHLSKPAFYIPSPLSHIPDAEWINFDNKENAAVAVKRAYGRNKPSKKFAQRLNIKYHELGYNIDYP